MTTRLLNLLHHIIPPPNYDPLTYRHLHIFIVLLLLQSVGVYASFMVAPDGFIRNIYTSGYHIYVSIYNLLTTFIAVWLYDILRPKLVKNAFISLVIACHVLVFILDLFCFIFLDTIFNKGFVGIIHGTNPDEAIEFLGNYCSGTNLWYLLGSSVLFCLLLVLLLEWKPRVGIRGLSFWCAAERIIFLFCISALLWSTYSWRGQVWDNTLVVHVSELLFGEKAPDLHTYFSNPALSETNEDHPQNVVVIWGESFSKNHSSLYGYDKETNPHLSLLKDSGLYVFPRIESPATHTIEAFKFLMSTYSSRTIGDGKQWYEYVTLPEILRICGYKTYWLSNQCPKGLYDNIVVRYAELCDTTVFITDKFKGYSGIKQDGALLDVIPQYTATMDSTARRCYFIHLIGSHYIFEERYPASFDFFKEEDYNDKPSRQRQTLAAYDNSIRYNDSVVREIIRLFEAEECIVVYLSDHAIEVYDLDDSYYGHARDNEASQKVGKQIPFMIYASPLFQKRFPTTMQKIEQNLETPCCTEDLLYTLLDIIGYKFADNDDVRQYTLFK